MIEEYLITETIGPRAPVVFSFYEDEGLLLLDLLIQGPHIKPSNILSQIIIAD